MTTLSTKGQDVALLIANVARMRSLTDTLFDDCRESANYTDAIESEIQYFLGGFLGYFLFL